MNQGCGRTIHVPIRHDRISAAVFANVVSPGRGYNQGALFSACHEDLGPGGGMGLDDLHLFGSQLAGFEQDLFGHAALAEIVDQTRGGQLGQDLGRPAQFATHHGRQGGHPDRMADGVAVVIGITHELHDVHGSHFRGARQFFTTGAGLGHVHVVVSADR